MPPQDDELVARAATTITAGHGEVWSALVDPTAIKQYMFGATVETDWRVGTRTRVSLTQDGSRTVEAREHSEENWGMMLDSLRGYVEERQRGVA